RAAGRGRAGLGPALAQPGSPSSRPRRGRPGRLTRLAGSSVGSRCWSMTAPDVGGRSATAADAAHRPRTGGLDATMVGIARSGTFNLAGSAVSALSQFVVVLLATRLFDASQAGALFA